LLSPDRYFLFKKHKPAKNTSLKNKNKERTAGKLGVWGERDL
jgi:hypothetical protein